jgi:PAS domain S-box-containing protein
MNYSELLAGAVLATVSDAIIAADKDNIVRFWNPGAQRIFGYTCEEAIGQSLDIIIPERLRKRHWEGYRRVMAGGESRYGHGDILAVPGVKKDGAEISVEFTIIPLMDNRGGLIGVAAIMRDVTTKFNEMRALKRKLADAAKAAV